MNEQAVYAKSVLDTGLTIVSEYIPSVRSESIGVWIQAGSRDEAPETNGISHFIEHMVFKGTSHRTAEEIARSLESVGGHLNAFTGKESTCYYARVLDEHVSLAIDVLSDILINPLLKVEDIEKEKSIVLEEIKNLDDTPDELIHDLFSESLFTPHPLSLPILGPEKNVKAFSENDLEQYKNTHYRAENVVIAAAGNMEHERLVDLIQEQFRFSTAAFDNGRPGLPDPSLRIDIHPKGIAQSHLCMGMRSYPFSDPQRFGLLVLQTLLGGGMSSRLFQQIREREGLAYEVYSFVDFYLDTGLFGVYVGSDASQVKRVLDMIVRELRHCASMPISADELARIKSQLKGNLMLGLESTSNRMIRLAKMQIYLDSYFSLDETLAEIDQVSVDDVHAVAVDLFDQEPWVITVLGPVDEDAITRDDVRFQANPS